MKIRWDELKVGDVFKDGSVVLDIKPWLYRDTFELKSMNTTICASNTHIFKAKLIKNGRNIYPSEFTKTILSNVGQEDDGTWYSAQDMYKAFVFGSIVLSLSPDGTKMYPITSIRSIGNKKVRCIKTSTGHYVIGDFTSHNTGGKNLAEAAKRDEIVDTYKGFKKSAILQRAIQGKTTEERRRLLYEGLKESYAYHKIAMDDHNLMIVAKKMTSYINDPVEGKRYVREGEVCDIMSSESIGSISNPFKKAELRSGYKHLTKLGEYETGRDAANEIIF